MGEDARLSKGLGVGLASLQIGKESGEMGRNGYIGARTGTSAAGAGVWGWGLVRERDRGKGREPDRGR